MRRSGRVVALGLALPLALAAGSGLLRRARQGPEYLLDPCRVGLGGRVPEWFVPTMARAFFASWREAAGRAGSFSLLDRAGLARFVTAVRGLPWVRRVGCRPVLPNRARLDVELRRPVAAVTDPGGRFWLVAADGALLAVDVPASGGPAGPALPFGLPWIVGARTRQAAAGAAAIAGLFRAKVLPRVLDLLGEDDPAAAPALRAVDATNAGSAQNPLRAEYSLRVAGRGGHLVDLAWGHGPRSPFQGIGWEDKARILALLLHEAPGLAGIARADLRFRVRWRDRIVRLGASGQ